MNISHRGHRSADCWDALAFPGDGLIARAGDHLMIVEVDDDLGADGSTDDLIRAHEAHGRLLGRGAAVSLRRSVDAILSDRRADSACAVAVVSSWDDQVAISLYGRAVATIWRGAESEIVDGREALINADRTIPANFDLLEVRVGDGESTEVSPLQSGGVAVGRGVRLVSVGKGKPEASDPSPAAVRNEWGAPASSPSRSR